MNLGSILSKLGKSALKSIPGVGTAIGVVETVNSFLGDDEKVSENSTGDEVSAAIAKLSSTDQAAILSKQIDVELAEIQSHTDVTKALAEVDKVGASTRPMIAIAFAFNLLIISDVLISGIVYAICKNMIDITGAWPLVVAIQAPFVWVIKSYFGYRHKEKTQKYEATTGTASKESIVSSLLSKFTGK